MSLPGHVQQLSAVNVDDTNQTRSVRRRKELPIGTHSDDGRLLGDFGQTLRRPRRNGPVPCKVIGMSGCHARSVCEQREVANLARRIDAPSWSSIVEVPEPDCLVCRCRRQSRTTWQKRQRGYCRLMTFQRQTGFARFSIPQPDHVVGRC